MAFPAALSLSLLSCCLISPLPVLAASAGSSAAAFLDIGFGSRAQGLANGVVALADDATASYFNPAGLAGAPRELHLSHSIWFQDIKLSQAAFSLPSSARSAGEGGRRPDEGGRPWSFAFAVTRLGIEGLEARTSETAKPEGTFGAEDLALGLSLARPVGPGAAGATLKLVQQRIASTTGRGAAVDLGARLPLSGRLSAGLSVRNLGPDLKLGSEASPLPLSVHAGLAYRAPLTLVLEAGRSRDRRSTLVLGSEYWPNDSFALRGGYLQQLSGAGTAGGGQTGIVPFPGVSAGFGLRLGRRLTLDYAIAPYRDLGSAHRFSLSMRF